jgi:hypothetical protein
VENLNTSISARASGYSVAPPSRVPVVEIEPPASHCRGAGRVNRIARDDGPSRGVPSLDSRARGAPGEAAADGGDARCGRQRATKTPSVTGVDRR